MKNSVKTSMHLGAVALFVVGTLVAASPATVAADTVTLDTRQISISLVVVDVRNETDRPLTGVVNVPVLDGQTPLLVPIEVDLAPGESVKVTIDLAATRLPLGPVASTNEGPMPF